MSIDKEKLMNLLIKKQEECGVDVGRYNFISLLITEIESGVLDKEEFYDA